MMASFLTVNQKCFCCKLGAVVSLFYGLGNRLKLVMEPEYIYSARKNLKHVAMHVLVFVFRWMNG